MTRYHCPYCSYRYQIHKQRADGMMICGSCGDPLVKVPLIRPIQVFALIAALAFLTPLIVMLLALLQEQKTPESNGGLPPIAFLRK